MDFLLCGNTHFPQTWTSPDDKYDEFVRSLFSKNNLPSYDEEESISCDDSKELPENSFTHFGEASPKFWIFE